MLAGTSYTARSKEMHTLCSGPAYRQVSPVQLSPSQALRRQPPRSLATTNALKSWQIQRLQEASAQGRRKLSVKQLCGDLQMERADVLKWLKEHQQSADIQSEAHRSPSEPASSKGDRYTWGNVNEQNSASSAGSSSQPQKRQKERLRVPGELPYNPRSAPWAQNYRLKKLPKVAELTLEKVYEEWPHPPMSIIDSLWDLHQIPRRRAQDWFATRRREEAQGAQHLPEVAEK